MRRTVMGMTLLSVVFFVASAMAGKIDDVHTEVKKSCGKQLTEQEALRMVKNLFLSCVPGHKVEVDGCKLACLKKNVGAVVGQ